MWEECNDFQQLWKSYCENKRDTSKKGTQVHLRKSECERLKVDDLFLEATDPFTIYFKHRDEAYKLAQNHGYELVKEIFQT